MEGLATGCVVGLVRNGMQQVIWIYVNLKAVRDSWLWAFSYSSCGFWEGSIHSAQRSRRTGHRLHK